MSTCSICLNDVRPTRLTSAIRCGHLFHAKCLDAWKAKGKNTCPLCRKVFDVSKYKILVTIVNNYTDQSNVFQVGENSIFSILDALDITFDMEDTLDVERLLSDFGLDASNFNPSVFYAE